MTWNMINKIQASVQPDLGEYCFLKFRRIAVEEEVKVPGIK